MLILTIFLAILSVISLFMTFLLHCQYEELHEQLKFKTRECVNTYRKLLETQQENKDLNKIRRMLEHNLKEIELVAFRNDYDNLKIAINKIRELIHDRKLRD